MIPTFPAHIMRSDNSLLSVDSHQLEQNELLKIIERPLAKCNRSGGCVSAGATSLIGMIRLDG